MLSHLKQKQQEFFLSGETNSLMFRKNQLKKLKLLIYSYYDELLEALDLDLNKSEFESVASELYIVIDEIDYFCKNLSKWSRPKTIGNPFLSEAKGEMITKSFGTTLILSSWNYPIQQALLPLVGAIGGGNCAVIKIDAMTPHVASVLEKLVNNHFDEQFLKVVSGTQDLTIELLELEFDKIFATGSQDLGTLIWEKTACYMPDISLELSSKSPAIIDKLSKKDLHTALKRIFWGKFLNGAQSYVAPDYLLVNSSMEAGFLAMLTEVTKEFLTEKPRCQIVNEQLYKQLKSYLLDADILFGGLCSDDDLTMELTLIKIYDLNAKVLRDEIFGPILPVIFYEDTKDALNIARQICEEPFSLYIFSNKKSFTDTFINGLSFYGVTINDTIPHNFSERLAFGGVHTSAVGRYHGRASFDCFTKRMTILRKGLGLDLGAHQPTYKSRIEFLLSSFLKKK
ncbi:MAG: aldehyde dehydrogenase family protein [Brevinema sp.]